MMLISTTSPPASCLERTSELEERERGREGEGGREGGREGGGERGREGG